MEWRSWGTSSRLYSEQLPPEKVQSVIVEPAKEIELAIRTAEAKGEENSKPQSEQKEPRVLKIERK